MPISPSPNCRSRFACPASIAIRVGCRPPAERYGSIMTDQQPFANIPPTPEGHFTLYFYAAVLYVLDHVTRLFDAPDEALHEFPFLVGYHQQLAGCGLEGKSI